MQGKTSCMTRQMINCVRNKPKCVQLDIIVADQPNEGLFSKENLSI